MKRTPLLLALAASAAMAAPSLALAQPYGSSTYQDQSYQRQQDEYQLRMQQYNDQRATYDEQQQRQFGYDHRQRSDRSNSEACYGRNSDGSVAGGLIGALAGAAIGSSVAPRHDRGEGAVLGAVAGGVVGSNIGRNTARCDDRGYYFSRDQTSSYEESRDYRGRSSGRHDYAYYSQEGCRLAVAPARLGDNEELRYVRVCPDGSGRYRLAE